MVLTDSCDLYGAVHEEGHQWCDPSQHAAKSTAVQLRDRGRSCQSGAMVSTGRSDSDVSKHFNPLFTIMNPPPVLGADSPPVGLGFIMQLSCANRLPSGKIVSLLSVTVYSLQHLWAAAAASKSLHCRLQ